MKFVINRCFGGFGLSNEAIKELDISEEDIYDLERNDPRLVAVVEKLGDRANGDYAKLRVVEVDILWSIRNYDGREEIEIGNCRYY